MLSHLTLSVSNQTAFLWGLGDTTAVLYGRVSNICVSLVNEMLLDSGKSCYDIDTVPIALQIHTMTETVGINYFQDCCRS